MATLQIKDQSLVVTVEGLDKILALRSSITVPLAHISGVSVRPDISQVMYMPVGSQFRGVRNPGSVIAGTLIMADGSGYVFCDVHDETRALAIELQHDEFKRLIIEVSDQTPEQARDMIVRAVGPRLHQEAQTEGDQKPDEPRPVPVGTTR
jgi:hypothetical protein